MRVDGKIEVYGYQGLKGSIPCTRHLLATNGGLFPGIVSFADGEVCVFYRGTADHLNTRSNISMRRSKDFGETWSEAQIVTDEADDRNPAVGIIEPGIMVMLYASRQNPEQKGAWQWEGNKWQVKYRRSDDRGQTWGEAKNVPNPPGYTLCSPGGGSNVLNWGPGMLLGNVFGLAGDTQYTGQPLKEWFGFPLAYSPLEDTWKSYLPPIVSGSDETDFFDSAYGLGAMIRTGGMKFHACYVRYFTDGGKWSKPILAFPDGMHPCRITKLPDDGMLLATVGRRRYPYGAMCLISRDGGKTWDQDNQFILADNCGKGEVRGDNGYASSTLLPTGDILSVWYKNISDAPYFPGTGEMYTLEMAKYRLADLLKWNQYEGDGEKTI
jgi:hypothetical protein